MTADSPDTSLDAIRREIDAIDDQILRLLMQRFAATGRVKATKAQDGSIAASPFRPAREAAVMRRLIGEFRELGGVGIEVVSGSHSRDEACVYAQRAQEHRLLASAGSDYHGPEHPYLELGRLPKLPPSCTPIWADW